MQNPNNAQFSYCLDRFGIWDLWQGRRYTRDINPLNAEINLHDIQFVPRRERRVRRLVRLVGESKWLLIVRSILDT